MGRGPDSRVPDKPLSDNGSCYTAKETVEGGRRLTCKDAQGRIIQIWKLRQKELIGGVNANLRSQN